MSMHYVILKEYTYNMNYNDMNYQFQSFFFHCGSSDFIGPIKNKMDHIYLVWY